MAMSPRSSHHIFIDASIKNGEVKFMFQSYGTMSLEPQKEVNMARAGLYDKEFKESIIQYVLDHLDETYVSVGKRFDVHSTTIGGQMKEYKENGGNDVFRGK